MNTSREAQPARRYRVYVTWLVDTQYEVEAESEAEALLAVAKGIEEDDFSLYVDDEYDQKRVALGPAERIEETSG